MTTYAVRNEYERELAAKAIGHRKIPFTAVFNSGLPRSNDQNRLNRLWMNELESQDDNMTAEEYRGWCKLHIGIPILRNEDEAFCEEYDRVIKPMPYELKLTLMMVPFDFGVTRLMTVKQEMTYLDRVFRHFTEKGFQLTEPKS